MRIEYHRTLIADKSRNEAFYRALSKVITPGETIVADIGAGTGLLGLLASKLGARQVYLYEMGEVAGVAQDIVRANGAQRCEVIPCHSREMIDPPKVDVIVSETLGNYAFEENIISTLNDARERFLKPDGIIVPAGVEQFVSPVIAPRIDNELRIWEDVGFDMDMSRAQLMSLNNVYVRKLRAEELLDPLGVVWDSVDFFRKEKASRKGEARWQIGKALTIYGLCVWWRAQLVEGVVLSTGPSAPASHWEQLYFPMVRPVEAGMGDLIVASIRSRSLEETGTHLAWSVSHLDAAGKRISRQAMDLDQGFLP